MALILKFNVLTHLPSHIVVSFEVINHSNAISYFRVTAQSCEIGTCFCFLRLLFYLNPFRSLFIINDFRIFTCWCLTNICQYLSGDTTLCFSLSSWNQFYTCKLIIVINFVVIIGIIQVRSKSLDKLCCLNPTVP